MDEILLQMNSLRCLLYTLQVLWLPFKVNTVKICHLVITGERIYIYKVQSYGGLSVRGMDRTTGGFDRVGRYEQVLRETGHAQYKLQAVRESARWTLKLSGEHISCLSL